MPVQVPFPDLDQQELDRAVLVWKSPSSYGLEAIRQALSCVRVWHADRVDMLRRLPGGSDAWKETKREEEILEVYLIDLKDALIQTMHINKMAGGE